MTNQNYMNIEDLYIQDMDAIGILDIVRYAPGMNMDALMFRYYPGGPIDDNGIDQTLEYLPLVLMFNNIPDLATLQHGTLIRFPNLSDLLSQLISLDFADYVPGVVTVAQNAAVVQNQTSNGVATTAMPKINITLPKVSVDPQTGIITF
jgi:hypothetical protein